MSKKNLILPILAVIVGIAASAFTRPIHKNNKSGTFYFLYNSSPGGEGTNTNWIETDAAGYAAEGCLGANDGCELIANDTVEIGGTVYPKEVYILQNTAHTPTVGMYVTAVSNKN